MCAYRWTYRRHRLMHRRAYQRFFCGGCKGQNHSELRTKDRKWRVSASALFSQRAAMTITFQSHGGREDGPISQPWLLLFLFFYATSFYLDRKCSVPTPTHPPLNTHTRTGLMWTHTRRAFITLCRCHTPSPWQSHTPSFLKIQAIRIQTHTLHEQIKLAFQHLKKQKILISDCLMSCEIRPSFQGGMRSS